MWVDPKRLDAGPNPPLFGLQNSWGKGKFIYLQQSRRKTRKSIDKLHQAHILFATPTKIYIPNLQYILIT